MLSTRTSMANRSRYCVSMMPTDSPDDAPAMLPRSMTVTSATPRTVRCQAGARPSAPAPTTTTDAGPVLTGEVRGGLLADDGPEEAHHDEEATEQAQQADAAVRGV